MIFPEIMQELYAYMAGIACTHQSQVYELEELKTMFHLLVSLPSTLPLCKLVEEIKKGSSKWNKTKGNSYIYFAWQNGYGAFSIGQSAYEDLRKYIQMQKEHHKKMLFQDE